MDTVKIHNLSIRFECPLLGSAEEFLYCFKPYLRADPAAEYTVVIDLEKPLYANFPRLKANFVTPRNAVFTAKAEKIIDYGGSALVKEITGEKKFRIISEDKDLIKEICYHLVISLLGQHCDRDSILKIHALAVSFKEEAAVIMMPSGGGKSTLELNLLSDPDFKMISEDISLIDRRLNLLPFPMPLGFNDPSVPGVPDKYIIKTKRMEFHDKYRIDMDFLKNKLEHRRLNNISLFAGVRLLNGFPEIKPMSKIKALRYLFRDAVVGIGVYQGLEFLLTRSMADIFKKIPVAFKRFWICLKLVFARPAFVFYLSRDTESNARCLKSFLESSNSEGNRPSAPVSPELQECRR